VKREADFWHFNPGLKRALAVKSRTTRATGNDCELSLSRLLGTRSCIKITDEVLSEVCPGFEYNSPGFKYNTVVLESRKVVENAIGAVRD
jgi:hypothetical protein